MATSDSNGIFRLIMRQVFHTIIRTVANTFPHMLWQCVVTNVNATARRRIAFRKWFELAISCRFTVGRTKWKRMKHEWKGVWSASQRRLKSFAMSFVGTSLGCRDARTPGRRDACSRIRYTTERICLIESKCQVFIRVSIQLVSTADYAASDQTT